MQWALDYARRHGLRRTNGLEQIIHFFLTQSEPVTWTDICNAPEIKDKVDPATVFRILTRMEKINLLRRLGFHERSAYYILPLPNEHHDYLMCTECGDIQLLDMSCPVHTFEKKVSENSGFKNIHHELEFYGICPSCQTEEVIERHSHHSCCGKNHK